MLGFTNDTAGHKDIIKDYFDKRDFLAGHVALKRFLSRELNLASAQWALQFKNLLNENCGLIPFRIAILRSYTVEPIVPLLKALALVHNIDLDIWVGGFNSYAQEIIDSSSALYQQNIDAAYLGILSRDICPNLWDGAFLFEEQEGKKEYEKACELLTALFRNYRERSTKPLIVQGLEYIPSKGRINGFEAQNNQAFDKINTQIRNLSAQNVSTYVTDYASLIAYYGYANWFNERKWHQVSQNISSQHLPDFARSLMHYIVPLAKSSAKVIVTDLDHTLWNGVIGEDGLESIKITDEGKKGGHKSYQKALKDLKKSGFLLAVVSKNNPEDAMSGIKNHPDMVLQEDDFVVIKANWQNKAENIQAIAQELNLGLESFVFIDDNPVERETVARTFPEITIIELPDDPSLYKQTLLDCPRLSKLSVTEEDRKKSEVYAAENERKKALDKIGDITSFLYDLNLNLKIQPVSKETLARAAQLTQKTNQFNITTFRYTENEIQAMIEADGQYRTYIVHAEDRFGDHGWIALALLKIEKDDAWFDTFLMSCRVLGRGVEASLLSHICIDLKRLGINNLYGGVLFSKKNEPAQDFFEANGFSADTAFSLVNLDERFNTQEASFWKLSLKEDRLPQQPAWVTLKEE